MNLCAGHQQLTHFLNLITAQHEHVSMLCLINILADCYKFKGKDAAVLQYRK